MTVLRCCALAAAFVAVSASPAPMAAPAGAVPYVAYVTNLSAGDYVGVYDLRSLPFTTQLTSVDMTTGAVPKGIVAASSRNRVYVASSVFNFIEVIDTTTNTLVPGEQISVAPSSLTNLGEMVISPDERWLWVVGSMSGPFSGVTKIDLNVPGNQFPINLGSGGPATDICFKPGLVEFGGSGNSQIFVTVPSAGTVYELSYPIGVTGSSSPPVSVAIPAARWVDVSPDLNEIYVTSGNTGPTAHRCDIPFGTPAQLTQLPPQLGMDDYNEVAFSGTQGPPYAYFVQEFMSGPGRAVMPVDAIADDDAGGTPYNMSGHALLPTAMTISIDPTGSWAFIGGTGTRMVVIDLTSPFAPGPAVELLTANDPWRVAFLSTTSSPAPVLHNVCPRAGVALAQTTFLLEGSGFQPGATVAFGGMAVLPQDVTFIDSTKLIAIAPFPSPAIAPPAEVLVTNPDVQSSTLPAWCRETLPLPSPLSFTVPPGSTTQDYRMYSLPQMTMWQDFKAAMIAAFGVYDPGIWRAFLWSPRLHRYLEFPEIPDDFCEMAATPMWILSKFGGTVSAPGLDCAVGIPDFPQVLYPGWNMVAWPYDTTGGDWNPSSGDIDIGDFGGTVPGGDTNPVTNSFGNGLLFEWTGSAYGSSAAMEQKKGYWVFNKTGSPNYLFFTDSGGVGRLDRRPPGGPDVGAPDPWRGGSWRGLPLGAPAMGDLVRSALALMAALPPPPPGRGLGGGSEHPFCAVGLPVRDEPSAVHLAVVVALFALAALTRRRRAGQVH